MFTLQNTDLILINTVIDVNQKGRRVAAIDIDLYKYIFIVLYNIVVYITLQGYYINIFLYNYIKISGLETILKTGI